MELCSVNFSVNSCFISFIFLSLSFILVSILFSEEEMRVVRVCWDWFMDWFILERKSSMDLVSREEERSLVVSVVMWECRSLWFDSMSLERDSLFFGRFSWMRREVLSRSFSLASLMRGEICSRLLEKMMSLRSSMYCFLESLSLREISLILSLCLSWMDWKLEFNREMFSRILVARDVLRELSLSE